LPDADWAVAPRDNPEQEPLLLQLEPLRVILEKLEFAVGG